MPQSTAPTGDKIGVYVCNPESDLVSRSEILSFLARQRSTVRNLQSVAGLFADHPTKNGRERFSITNGKLLICDELAECVRTFPSASENLVGKKPFLDMLENELVEQRKKAIRFAGRCHDPLDSNPDFAESEYSRADGAVSCLRRLIDRFSGSAEEQPETREEAGGPIGEKPCDGPPANLHSLSDADLSALSESVLEEIEIRSGGYRWGVS